MVATRDISSLAIKLSDAGAAEIDFSFLANSPLAVLDPTGHFQPLLATELPSLERGTWVVRPDGTMQTTWTIRPQARWHDGQPVTVQDFIFALAVYRDPALLVPDRRPEEYIDHISAVDDHTFRIDWNQSYLQADQLIFKRLPPLPAHVLGPLYRAGDPQAFQNDPFWTSPAYVGDGPFRLVAWDKGVEQRYAAFDQYFLGRPQLDEIVVKIIPDANAVLGNVLSGAVDFTGAASLSPETAHTADAAPGHAGGQVVHTMGSLRAARFQYDPAVTTQPALADVRVRQAIALGIDRAAIADLVSAGTSLVAETPVAPGHPLYDRVQQAIAHYPYDPARARSLLADAGWGVQGTTLVNLAGQPFTLDITGSRSQDNDTERGALQGYLTQLGMQVTVSAYDLRATDREQIAKFPGLRTGTAIAEDLPSDLNIYTTAQCPTAATRYVGDNGGCWSNAAFDQLYQVATTSLGEAERADATVQALTILTDEVGILGLSHLVQHDWIRAGLVGPGPLAAGQKGGYTWNVQDWHWAT